MKLLPRRHRAPSPLERGFNILALVLRALTAQRVARRVHRNRKRVHRVPLLSIRRIPLFIGAAIAGSALVKKLRGGGDTPGPETWTAPPAASTPSPIQTAGTGTPPPESGPEAGGGPEVPADEDGAPSPDISAGAAATDAGTTAGGSAAASDDEEPSATSDAAADAIGDDLASAAGGAAPTGDTGEVPTPSQEDFRAPAADEEEAGNRS